MIIEPNVLINIADIVTFMSWRITQSQSDEINGREKPRKRWLTEV